jgi:hypothetical protein
MSAEAFPNVYFLIQLIYFHTLKSAPRDDAYNPPALDYWKMTEAEFIHLPQRVDCATIRTYRDGIGRHCLRQSGNFGTLTLGKRTHRISPGENAGQPLLMVNHQN